MLTNYIRAFVVKFIGVGVLTFSLYGVFYHASIGRLLLMTFVVAGITFLGDLFILPRVNQAVAALGDFGLFFLLYWLLGNLVVEDTVPLLLPTLAAAYFGTFAEAIYHIYAMDRLHEPPRTAPLPTRYQTEIGEESDAEAVVRNKQNNRNNEQ